MAFRKRNIGIGRNPQQSGTFPSPNEPPLSSPDAPNSRPNIHPSPPSGTRPSPLDGRLTTSTGTPSLDALLAGHSGLPLGQSLLIGENGTTDYAGALTRYFAAEGVMQGHVVHVLGVREGWGRELPGVVEGVDAEDGGLDSGGTASGKSRTQKEKEKERMKIAWRYEGLGQHGEARRAVDRTPTTTSAANPTANPTTPSQQQPFCHTFDLTKRLTHPSISKITYHHPTSSSNTPPFESCLNNLHHALTTTTPSTPTIHRLVIPTLLNPALYPPRASTPSHLLSFLHGLRSLTRQYPQNLVVMITLPLSLYPRTTAIVRWLEHLADGVLEVTPFPHSSSPFSSESTSSSGGGSGSGSGGGKDEPTPQGLVTVHKLPVYHERGGGGGGGGAGGEDLAFTVSRKRFEIRPFSLPPAEGDREAQDGGKGEGGGAGMEF